MRVLGLYRAAEAAFSHLSAPMRRALEAYAAGVNAFLATRRGALPPEFQLLRFDAGAVATGRQPRLGQADGSGADRQLPRRVAAGAPGAHACRPSSSPFSIRIIRKTRRPRWRSWRRSTAVCRSIRLYAGLAAEGRPDLRLEQLGRRRRAQRQRQAAAGQRPASRVFRARRLVSGAAQDAGARDRRRHGRRACRLS